MPGAGNVSADEGIAVNWKVPCKYQGGVAREAYKEAWQQDPSAVVALPAAWLVNTGPYRALTLFSILLTGSSVTPTIISRR
jgi:hypothetical protein